MAIGAFFSHSRLDIPVTPQFLHLDRSPGSAFVTDDPNQDIYVPAGGPGTSGDGLSRVHSGTALSPPVVNLWAARGELTEVSHWADTMARYFDTGEPVVKMEWDRGTGEVTTFLDYDRTCPPLGLLAVKINPDGSYETRLYPTCALEGKQYKKYELEITDWGAHFWFSHSAGNLILYTSSEALTDLGKMHGFRSRWSFEPVDPHPSLMGGPFQPTVMPFRMPRPIQLRTMGLQRGYRFVLDGEKGGFNFYSPNYYSPGRGAARSRGPSDSLASPRIAPWVTTALARMQTYLELTGPESQMLIKSAGNDLPDPLTHLWPQAFRKAFRSLFQGRALAWHPDQHPREVELHEKFKRLSSFYAILSGEGWMD